MLLTTYLEKAKLKEENNFHPKAAFSKDYQRLEKLEKQDRLAYNHDVDRIIHSKPYSRYVDKTQVVYLADNDHITHRSLHVQLVSHFARSIAEDLNLNVDLVEAISFVLIKKNSPSKPPSNGVTPALLLNATPWS